MAVLGLILLIFIGMDTAALFTNPQIRLSPTSLVEGDEMTISCDANLGDGTELQFAFYKNGINVQGFSDSCNYTVPSAQLEESGNYTCEVKKISPVLHIQVEELFSIPHITVSPDQVTEGNQINITCDTKLSPHRETTELQFVFYRNGHNVQGFSLSNQYGVPSAQLEHSGNYTCEVQTPTGTLRKRSSVAHIQIQGATPKDRKNATDISSQISRTREDTDQAGASQASRVRKISSQPPFQLGEDRKMANAISTQKNETIEDPEDRKMANAISTQKNETIEDPEDRKMANAISTQKNETIEDPEDRKMANAISTQKNETIEDPDQAGASQASRVRKISSQPPFQLGERSQMYLVLGIIGTLLALLILAVVFVIKNKQKRASWLIQHLQLLKTAHSRIPKVNMSSAPILISFVPEKPAYTELSSPQGTTEHLNQKRHHQNNNTQSTGTELFGQGTDFSDLTDETAIFKEHFPESSSIPFSNGHSVGKSQI